MYAMALGPSVPIREPRHTKAEALHVRIGRPEHGVADDHGDGLDEGIRVVGGKAVRQNLEVEQCSLLDVCCVLVCICGADNLEQAIDHAHKQQHLLSRQGVLVLLDL